MEEEKYRFVGFLQSKKKEDVVRESHIKRSRENLRKIVAKRIQTTMIGALAAIEEKFKEFWEPEEGEKMNKEQQNLYNLFQEIRSSILDNGNNQIRLLEKDIENFDVEARQYHIQLKVKERE